MIKMSHGGGPSLWVFVFFQHHYLWAISGLSPFSSVYFQPSSQVGTWVVFMFKISKWKLVVRKPNWQGGAAEYINAVFCLRARENKGCLLDCAVPRMFYIGFPRIHKTYFRIRFKEKKKKKKKAVTHQNLPVLVFEHALIMLFLNLDLLHSLFLPHITGPI